MRLALMLGLFLQAYMGYANDCLHWFKEGDIQPGPKCMFQCLSLPVNMRTFNCPRECRKFCKETQQGLSSIYHLTYYWGFTFEEIKLAATHLNETIVAYQQKNIAEETTLKIFKRNKDGDESDAFRHFLWAGLLAKEVGPELAQKFLNAHESGQKFNNPYRAMDIANNYEGLITAIKLHQQDRLTQAELTKEGLKAIKENRLSILKPLGGAK